MRRGRKPAKAKSKAKRPVAGKSRKGVDSRVRDLKERLAEALDQQTATGEMLRLISRSPTDLQPLLETVAQNASRLGGAANVSLYRVEGDLMRKVAEQGPPLTTLRVGETRPITRMSVSGRAIVERTTIHLPDHQSAEAVREYPDARRDTGIRTTLGMPLLREGIAVGALTAYRTEARMFSEREIALLQTFAEQAVIAIENVRLFNETREALEQQTATAEILRVISRSPSDVQPVFDAIVANASRLCDAAYSAVARLEDGRLHLVAVSNMSPEETAAYHGLFPRSPGRHFIMGRAFLERRPIHVEDIDTDPEYEPRTRQVLQRAAPYRTFLGIPILRDGVPIGAIGCGRREVKAFTVTQIQLVKTFADQAVIAIENVRLFKELEAANRELAGASQHKSEFLANMSHELRTPLNAIIGFSEGLLERLFGEMSEKQEEYLKDIHTSGQHLLSLINDILDLSKIEAGRMELELTEFDLPTAIENALTLVRERAARHGITVHHQVDARLGQTRGDERKLKQVLLNLLSNAIKFTPEGGRIEVRAALVDGLAEVSVVDTGVGIAPEDQEAIFEEFRQVGAAAKKVEGTGLGLTLSRKFVGLHGGRIWVRSELGRGSTFTFTLPVQSGA